MTTLHELGLKELTSVQPGNYSVSLYTTGEKSVLVAWVIRRGRIDQPDTVQFNSQLLSTDGLSADQEQRCRHWYDCHIKARQIA